MFSVVYMYLMGVTVALWGIQVQGHSKSYCNPQKTLDIVQKAMNCGQCDRKSHGLKAAFSVHSTRPFTAKRSGDVLPFQAIELNVGNGFHNNVFTCPDSGFYYLHWSIFTNPKKVANSHLRVNGNVKRFSANNNHGAASYPTAANAIIILLKKGDRVWLDAWRAGNYYREWATFQGWLIHTV